MAMMDLRKDADYIIEQAISRVMPDEAVKTALVDKDFGGKNIYVIAAGKAAWQMAKAASEILGDKIKNGVVITKYNHVKGQIENLKCYEAGHPVPDENSFKSTKAAVDLVEKLGENDQVLFLLSGGGSALFESPLIDGTELQDITNKLLACGASIVEMNTIRKRLSAVKGGKFAQICTPASVYCIVLSDIVGDPLDMIASGPAYPDSSSCEDALAIVEKYQLQFSDNTMSCLKVETPKILDNVETKITGSVRNLCKAAGKAAESLGYKVIFLTDHLECEAREAGAFLAAIARSHQNTTKSIAFIAGGETVVHLTGKGKGGRNQEIALSAAEKIDGLKSTAVFSLGSDGTDGPTDAAGGFVDGTSSAKLAAIGISVFDTLKNNDAYNALKAVNGLIITGATGTNVNDVALVLIKRK